MNVFTRAPTIFRARSGWPGAQAGATLTSTSGLLEELVAPVRLDLEDVEPPVQRVVRLRGELEAPAEDPLLQVRTLLDVPQHGASIRDLALAVLAGQLDRVQRDQDGPEGRRAERADLLAGIVLLPAGDDRLVVGEQADRSGEVRDVRAGRLELARPVRTVAAEHLRLLPLLHQLLRERLRVLRLLRREEHDVGVAGNLGHEGREVRDR